ncbi:hypothetical protein FQN51_006588 [Onygenales sp. PD_10]|nr:hypothetical protein FQN51_006588 [Onygenales sp. PD_10]
MPPKRKHRGDEADDESDRDRKRFAMLKPRTRHIAEHTIKTKWTTLPDSVQEKVKELFRSIERPVITRHRDERKRIDAQAAVVAVRRNLGRRLPRMPFPPATKDADFDYETALEENRTLELQLSSTTNSADLLRAEIKREEAELAKETAQLEELEKNAKAAKAERKRQTKNAHPVIRRLEGSRQKSDGAADFSFTGPKNNGGMLCEIDADSELHPLIKQLRNHLESMQNNASQIAGLGEAIARSHQYSNNLQCESVQFADIIGKALAGCLSPSWQNIYRQPENLPRKGISWDLVFQPTVERGNPEIAPRKQKPQYKNAHTLGPISREHGDRTQRRLDFGHSPPTTASPDCGGGDRRPKIFSIDLYSSSSVLQGLHTSRHSPAYVQQGSSIDRAPETAARLLWTESHRASIGNFSSLCSTTERRLPGSPRAAQHTAQPCVQPTAVFKSLLIWTASGCLDPLMTAEGERLPAHDDGERPSNGGPDTMPSNSATTTTDGDAQPGEMNTKNLHSSPKAADGAPASSSPKKRRKVNHACVYCRRSAGLVYKEIGLADSKEIIDIGVGQHMTCDSRNIGHLCHDEPRDNVKRAKSEHETTTADEEGPANNDFANVQNMPRKIEPHEIIGDQVLHNPALSDLSASIEPSPATSQGISTAAAQPINVNPQQLIGYNDWQAGAQNQFQDMHTFHPSYMFNHPEVTNEYNLLNDFLSTSLLDDASMYPGEEMPGPYSDSSLLNSMVAANMPLNNGSYLQQQQQQQHQQQQQAMLPPSQLAPPSQNASAGNSIQRPSSNVGNEKAKETYYMTAADPSGTDPPEERMNKLLKAKYDAGLLKPFNYVGGYARLNSYMEKHLEPASRQKILRQLDKFRPKFRERMQSLTDMELLVVEMWFERSLMEYDRVFASMAIPACCWRRTGQIFRGNKEMAQLIDVPIESLRDGKLAIHEIIVEDQLVSYWEKFGAIAFDSTQKAMLTSCTLKNPNSNNPGQGIKCCFSFTIRRDTHNIPSLIVGNFLPMKRTDR